MAKIVKGLESLSTVLICEYCANLSFKQIEDFIRWIHLSICNKKYYKNILDKFLLLCTDHFEFSIYLIQNSFMLLLSNIIN